jgi:D-serine deaminase-like pyridoxal phosphate-dependent protein
MPLFSNDDYFRYREALRDERLPAAFVDLDAFDANVDYVASTQRPTGKSIRVGTKSVRCVELIRRVFRRGGSAYRGILGFTMEEAAFLAGRGFDDIIVAYPSVQPSDIDLLVKLTKAKKLVALMVDSAEHLSILDAAGKRARVRLRACMEVDMAYHPLGAPVHLGLRRSPVRSVEQALLLARASKKYDRVTIDSVMGYEGHIAGLNDDVPGAGIRNAFMRAIKRASVRELTVRRDDIVDALRAEGLDLRLVNGGGSGSLVSSGNDPRLTEVTAGSAFYCSGLFHHFKEVRFRPSAFFAVQVVRVPASGMVTCLGGGYVASGAMGPDKLPSPVLPAGLRLLPLEAAGEVQTPLMLPEDCPPLSIGDPVVFQHAKAGELCERFNELLLVQGDRVVGRAKTYRGEGKAFL